MKSVKSVADLKQLALARGAKVELGNTRFNTTGERVTAFPKREMPAAAEPVAKPEPRELTGWRFKINRSADGQIDSIDATPIKP